MKLKGEKELTAEELYNSMDEELYDLTVAKNLEINKLDIANYDTFLNDMYEKSLDNLIYYRISTVIYKMDLEVSESKALLKLSESRKLVLGLTNIIKQQLENVNIHNDIELAKFLKSIITGISLTEQIGKGE